MRHLFHREGRAALASALQRYSLLAFDFDGTLAPIVPRSSDAQVPGPVAERLTRLAELRPVAVITGRSVDDVAPRLGFVPKYIVGNHGAEDPDEESRIDMAVLGAFRVRLADAREQLDACGIELEDKGYSIALNYRPAPDRAAAQHCVEVLLRDLDPGLRFMISNSTANIVVAGAPDKGDAMASLVARAHADSAIFVGDDLNDEAVFARAEPDWLTVRIGLDDPLSRADFFLDSYADVVTLLQTMLDVLAKPAAG